MTEKPESTAYSLVVLGRMNPSIHHPRWYRDVGVLTEEEEKAALGHPDCLCSAHLSNITTAAFHIQCDRDRWQVDASSEDTGRMTDVACKTFDVLEHTPVSAYGLNIHTHRRTTLPAVATSLTRLLGDLSLGLDSTEVKGGRRATVKYAFEQNTALVSLTVEPSVLDDSLLYLSLNYHHAISMVAPEKFDLTPLLVDAVARGSAHGGEIARRVVAAANETWPR